jgi:hypothetical protein
MPGYGIDDITGFQRDDATPHAACERPAQNLPEPPLHGTFLGSRAVLS